MRKVLYILGALEDSDLQWLLDAGSRREIAGGERLIAEGEAHGDLFIVVDGELSVSKLGHEIARLGAGEVVGDMSLLDSRPPVASVAATGATTVYAVPHTVIRRHLAADAAFAARFYRALCIFLANRLSRTDAVLAAGSRPAPQDESERDELSPETLESLALAGARFDWFLQQVRSA